MSMPWPRGICFMQKVNPGLDYNLLIMLLNIKQGFFLIALFLSSEFVPAQSVASLKFDDQGRNHIRSVFLTDKKILDVPENMNLFSLLIDSTKFLSSDFIGSKSSGSRSGILVRDSISLSIAEVKEFSPGIKMIIRFTNLSHRNHSIENLVPMGESSDRVYITAGGTKEWPHYLCRTLLFRPGLGPVGLILPDNAWHLGYADIRLNDSVSLTGLARRGLRDKEKSSIDRWASTLKPGGWQEYEVYFDVHTGDWHQGLKMMFQDRWIYDLKNFDNSMFERSDLQWMRSTYLMLLQFAWDKKYYDAAKGGYTFYNSFSDYDYLTGGYDVFTIWPTWPRLGLDQRNQWDMYRDLPGGLDELKRQAEFLHARGKKYFISYNPWDEGTRKEDQLKGMEELLRSTDADGVVLDTRGASSMELQAAADRVKPGIIMYSEGMAIPKDMPGIVSGRVHDALVLPPPVNMNKFIKPDFAIFRVLQLADDRIHREVAISFFNGYGVEINTMRPGRPAWMEEEYKYLGKALKILRENNSVFHNNNWLPLITTLRDSVYVNRWTNGEKILYTVYSANPEGITGPLFESVQTPEGMHWIDLWNHEDIKPVMNEGRIVIPVHVDRFEPSWLNSRREGNAGCIALLKELMEVKLEGGRIIFNSTAGDRIVMTAGNPSYDGASRIFSTRGGDLAIYNAFDQPTDKIVLQLFDKTELLDERVIRITNNIPLLVSVSERTTAPVEEPAGMKKIPGGAFLFYAKRDSTAQDPFIALPDHSDTLTMQMPSFYMDIYPVTNYEFEKFLKVSHYQPADTSNFLKHWIRGKIPDGRENYPVVYVSPEDAEAYAKWAGKRLPTEAEWQYAAQGTDLRKYPWGNKMDSTRCNHNLNSITPVNAFEQGASPFGIRDMIGNVWQMTCDVYDIGCYRYLMIRGGSYYHPTQSIWYVTGGPLPVYHPDILLLIAPGLDRNATVGFRCVMDAD